MPCEEDLLGVAEQHGAHANQQGGIYIHGQAYAFTKKLEVAAAYNDALRDGNGERPSISALSRE